MPVRAELPVRDPDFDERRAAHREPVDMRPGLRKTGYETAKAGVSDIPLTGCKVDSAMTLGGWCGGLDQISRASANAGDHRPGAGS